MGTSYQTLLLVGEPAELRPALTSLGVDAWLVPVGPGRVALLPREGDYDYADVEGLARSVGATLGRDCACNVVFDSDVVIMDVYRRGRRVHEYVSDVAMLPDGPSGEHRPRGAEPAVFAPLGVGSIDNAQLGAALRGEFAGDGPMFAEFQHRLILKAMNLEPRALTTAFRWARKEDLPGAVRVQPAAPAPVDGAGQGWATIELVLLAGLPAEVDMFAAGQVIADAVAGKAWPMRAEVGCMMVLPGAAGGRELMPAMMRLSPVPSIGTYFIKLRMTSASGRPDDDRVVEVAKQAWASALRSRLEIVFVRPEEFEIGFRAAARYLESQ